MASLPARIAIVLALASMMLAAIVPARAQLFETSAKQAILVDVDSGSILFSKEADTQVPPASLAKLMTMEVVFNAIRNGELRLDDEFLVSENAWRTGGAQSGGSTMFAELNSAISLENLIKGVIVQSANDGCIVIAEGMAGSEASFSRLMNDRAEKIGMTDSVFRNSTGLPDPEQRVTMRDLVKLAVHIQQTYPEFYEYYSMPSFEWNGILQRNRNPLLSMSIGADGMKTGFTEESGYAIVGSIKDEGRRLIVAMSGMETQRERREEARKLLQWGLRAFEPFSLFGEETVLGDVRLYGGETMSVPVRSQGAVRILLPLAARDDMSARIVFDGPVPAPVEEGDQIARLRVFVDEEIAQEIPLYAARSVAKGPIHRQAFDALTELVRSYIPELP